MNNRRWKCRQDIFDTSELLGLIPRVGIKTNKIDAMLDEQVERGAIERNTIGKEVFYRLRRKK